ncbi:MAG: translation initiation factor eIF-2B [Halofilum sp. (in: g-proteobacteria)]|nr:translation initiation factor eIF-2B [Halofilum sp. (in: g-proteobacteria)]
MDDAEFRRTRRRELVDDRVSGASQLARQALDSLAEFAGSCAADEPATLRAALLDFAEELQYTRPNMAPIHNLVQRWSDRVEALPDDDPAGFRRAAAEAAQELSDASVRAVEEVAAHTAALVGADATVITHSMSSTVHASFRLLARRGVRAIVSESRPGLEGRDQARQLDHLGIPVDFITDAELGHFSGHADVALVGADMLLADGALVNKAGTYLLALAARDRGIPFYVCCESFKQAPHGSTGFDLEAADPAELDAPRGRQITPHNVYFDITPARLIDARVTEDGVTRAGDAASS